MQLQLMLINLLSWETAHQANLTSFFQGVQRLVDKANIFVRYLTLCTVFDLVPNSILMLKNHRCTLSVSHTLNGLKAG